MERRRRLRARLMALLSALNGGTSGKMVCGASEKHWVGCPSEMRAGLTETVGENHDRAAPGACAPGGAGMS
jgi:hypothetical protein